MKVNHHREPYIWMEEHLYKNYNLMLLKEIQQLSMLRESKQVQDHMERDSRLGSKQYMLGQTQYLAHDRYLSCGGNINTRSSKEGETQSPCEIYNATNMIKDCFVSTVDSDVSALHLHVIDDIVAFVPILTLRQVLQSPDKCKWLEVVQVEANALYKNHTWTVVQKSPNSNVVSCKWLFIKNYNAHRNIHFKTGLVAKGFTQIHNVDYHETFSPTLKLTSL